MILFLENLLEKFVHGIPRRHRGKIRPRLEYLVEQVNEQGVEEAQKTVARELVLQAQEVASARTNYEIARYMVLGGGIQSRLAILEDKVIAAEEYMAMLQDEEDFIMVLALAV